MIYREGFDGPVKINLSTDKRIDTTVRFYDMTGTEPELIAETKIPAEGDIVMELPEEYFVKARDLADKASYKWVVADQKGNEFEPKAELPYSVVVTKTKTVMMIYREGFDGPVKINLVSAANTGA